MNVDEEIKNERMRREEEREAMRMRLRIRDREYAAKFADATAAVRGRVPGGCHFSVNGRFF